MDLDCFLSILDISPSSLIDYLLALRLHQLEALTGMTLTLPGHGEGLSVRRFLDKISEQFQSWTDFSQAFRNAVIHSKNKALRELFCQRQSRPAHHHSRVQTSHHHDKGGDKSSGDRSSLYDLIELLEVIELGYIEKGENADDSGTNQSEKHPPPANDNAVGDKTVDLTLPDSVLGHGLIASSPQVVLKLPRIERVSGSAEQEPRRPGRLPAINLKTKSSPQVSRTTSNGDDSRRHKRRKVRRRRLPALVQSEKLRPDKLWTGFDETLSTQSSGQNRPAQVERRVGNSVGEKSPVSLDGDARHQLQSWRSERIRTRGLERVSVKRSPRHNLLRGHSSMPHVDNAAARSSKKARGHREQKSLPVLSSSASHGDLGREVDKSAAARRGGSDLRLEASDRVETATGRDYGSELSQTSSGSFVFISCSGSESDVEPLLQGGTTPQRLPTVKPRKPRRVVTSQRDDHGEMIDSSEPGDSTPVQSAKSLRDSIQEIINSALSRTLVYSHGLQSDPKATNQSLAKSENSYTLSELGQCGSNEGQRASQQCADARNAQQTARKDGDLGSDSHPTTALRDSWLSTRSVESLQQPSAGLMASTRADRSRLSTRKDDSKYSVKVGHSLSPQHSARLLSMSTAPKHGFTSAHSYRLTEDGGSYDQETLGRHGESCGVIQTGTNASQLEHCDKCGLGLWKPEPHCPKFINLTMVMVTFADFKTHPAHFTRVVHSTLTIYGLTELIKSQTDIASHSFHVFKDKTKGKRIKLLPERTLEECGFGGGSDWLMPPDLTLYYDYEPTVINCPIIEYDYFITHPKAKAAAS